MRHLRVMQRPIIKPASTSGKAVPKSDMEAENRSVHCTNDAVLLERSSSHTLQQPLMRPRRTFAAAARAVRERTLVGSTQPTSPRQDNASALHPPVLRRRGGAQHHMETTYMRRSRRCPRLNFISCMPSVARGPCGALGQTAQLPSVRAGKQRSGLLLPSACLRTHVDWAASPVDAVPSPWHI